MGSYDHFFQRDSFFRHLAPEIYKVPTHTHICSKTPFFHSSSSNFFFGQSRKNNQTGASGPDDVSPTEMEREREREKSLWEISHNKHIERVFSSSSRVWHRSVPATLVAMMVKTITRMYVINGLDLTLEHHNSFLYAITSAAIMKTAKKLSPSANSSFFFKSISCSLSCAIFFLQKNYIRIFCSDFFDSFVRFRDVDYLNVFFVFSRPTKKREKSHFYLFFLDKFRSSEMRVNDFY